MIATIVLSLLSAPLAAQQVVTPPVNPDFRNEIIFKAAVEHNPDKLIEALDRAFSEKQKKQDSLDALLDSKVAETGYGLGALAPAAGNNAPPTWTQESHFPADVMEPSYHQEHRVMRDAYYDSIFIEQVR